MLSCLTYILKDLFDYRLYQKTRYQNLLGDYWGSRWKLQTNTVAVRVIGGYRKMVAGGWTVSCDRERGVGC